MAARANSELPGAAGGRLDSAAGDPDFAASLSRGARASVYLQAARFYLDGGDRANYFKYLRRALVTWPFGLEVHKAIGRHAAAKLREAADKEPAEHRSKLVGRTRLSPQVSSES